MNKNDQQLMAQKIRTQYMQREANELDTLRELDAKVKRPANIFSYIFGSISAIIMGCGMSLVMTDIAKTVGLGVDSMMSGIVIGVIGLGLALINYPLHKSIMESHKKKYAPQIIDLSDKIINK